MGFEKGRGSEYSDLTSARNTAHQANWDILESIITSHVVFLLKRLPQLQQRFIRSASQDLPQHRRTCHQSQASWPAQPWTDMNFGFLTETTFPKDQWCQKHKKNDDVGAIRGLNPGPLASNASGWTLSENHTTRPTAR
jgi:hypothetical protein